MNNHLTVINLLISLYKNGCKYLNARDFSLLLQTSKDVRTLVKYNHLVIGDDLELAAYKNLSLNFVCHSLKFLPSYAFDHETCEIFEMMTDPKQVNVVENSKISKKNEEIDEDLELFKNSINEPVSKKIKTIPPVIESRITWPNNVQKLTITELLDDIHWLPSGLKELRIITNSTEIEISYLPDSLTKLVFVGKIGGMSEPVTKLSELPHSSSLEILELVAEYDFNISFPKLRKFSKVHGYTKSIDHLQKLEDVTICPYHHNLIENLPLLKKLDVHATSQLALKSLPALEDLHSESPYPVEIFSGELPNLKKIESVSAQFFGFFPKVELINRCHHWEPLNLNQFPSLKKFDGTFKKNSVLENGLVELYLRKGCIVSSIQNLSSFFPITLTKLTVGNTITFSSEVLPRCLQYLKFETGCNDLNNLPETLEVLIISPKFMRYTCNEYLYYANGHYHLHENFENEDEIIFREGGDLHNKKCQDLYHKYIYVSTKSRDTSDFDADIKSLPKSLTYINMNTRFDKDLNAFKSLSKLKYLKLRGNFNKRVNGMLPDNLEYLYLGTSFNKNIDHLPSNLRYLNIKEI